MPAQQLVIATSFPQQLVKLSIVCWCKFGDQDPNKQITMWHVEMVEKIIFDLVPAGSIVSS